MVELEANNTSATKINEINGNMNGKKKCKNERVIKYLYRYKVKIKDTKKYMVRGYSEKQKNTKRKKCKKVYKYIKSVSMSKNRVKKYVRDNTCDVEQKGARRKNIKAKGKVCICMKKKTQKHITKTMEMVINGREYIEKKGRVIRKSKKS